MTPATSAPAGRPRVAGDREQEILTATLAVLGDVGYDRLTMDAVATRAHASKATLYRRWNGKVDLVIDALLSAKQPAEVPDTGTLRGDLVATYCGAHGLTAENTTTMASVLTALARDEDFAAAFRRDVIAPKMAITRRIFERARTRGELRDGVDLDLLAPALSGIVLHRRYVLGQASDSRTITELIDQIILPATLATDTSSA